MTPDIYSYLLSLIEYEEDFLFEVYSEGKTLHSLLQERAKAKEQLAELYTFYTLNK